MTPSRHHNHHHPHHHHHHITSSSSSSSSSSFTTSHHHHHQPHTLSYIISYASYFPNPLSYPLIPLRYSTLSSPSLILIHKPSQTLNTPSNTPSLYSLSPYSPHSQPLSTLTHNPLSTLSQPSLNPLSQPSLTTLSHSLTTFSQGSSRTHILRPAPLLFPTRRPRHPRYHQRDLPLLPARPTLGKPIHYKEPPVHHQQTKKWDKKWDKKRCEKRCENWIENEIGKY